MTETLTPAQFHEQAGVGDWRVIPDGAAALFRTGSFAVAAAFLPSIAAAADAAGIEPDVDLRPEAVLVRVPMPEGRLPAGIAEFAAAVSVAAAGAGLAADPTALQTIQVSVAQSVETRPFWAAALGYAEVGDNDVNDRLRLGPDFNFQPLDRPGRGRTHIDVHVPADQVEARVAAALAAGGRLADDQYAPMWWTIASPENHGVDIAAWIDHWKG